MSGRRRAKDKQPYAIALRDRRIMTLAGLWETWKNPASGERPKLYRHHLPAQWGDGGTT